MKIVSSFYQLWISFAINLVHPFCYFYHFKIVFDFDNSWWNLWYVENPKKLIWTNENTKQRYQKQTKTRNANSTRSTMPKNFPPKNTIENMNKSLKCTCNLNTRHSHSRTFVELYHHFIIVVAAPTNRSTPALIWSVCALLCLYSASDLPLNLNKSEYLTGQNKQKTKQNIQNHVYHNSKMSKPQNTWTIMMMMMMNRYTRVCVFVSVCAFVWSIKRHFPMKHGIPLKLNLWIVIMNLPFSANTNTRRSFVLFPIRLKQTKCKPNENEQNKKTIKIIVWNAQFLYTKQKSCKIYKKKW